MSKKVETIIVGGGIWGLSTAYHLSRYGQTDIHVLERNGRLFGETTSQAAGLVGQIRANPTMMEAIQYAIELYAGFKRETGRDPGFNQVGTLLAALTPERMASFKEQVRHASSKGVEAVVVDDAEMNRLAPDMDVTHLEGGYFVPADGYLDPQQCARALADAAEDGGVRIHTGVRVTGLPVSDGRITGVETESEFIEAENVIVTAGPWTGLLVGTAGYTPAMVPIRGQRAATVAKAGIPDHHPVVRVPDIGCYVRPENGGYLYGYFDPEPAIYNLESAPRDFKTKDIQATVDLMAEGRDLLAPIFPVLGELPVATYNQGLTTFAPDGAYLAGPVPDVEGLFAATGCASLGIAGAAAIGRWLAGWVVDGDPGTDVSRISFGRFGELAFDREWVRRKSEEFCGGYYSISAMSVDT